MAQKVTAMDVRMATALAGGVGNVAAFCRQQQISRQTFYRWRARVGEHGVDGLAELSRRPRRSPAATPATVEELIVRTRKKLADDGSDHGPWPIRWALLSDLSVADCDVPSGGDDRSHPGPAGSGDAVPGKAAPQFVSAVRSGPPERDVAVGLD